MFTIDNTEGFSQGQIDELNHALKILVAEGWDEKSASDRLNNEWTEYVQSAEKLLEAIRTNRTDRGAIMAADRDLLIDGIKHLYNCQEADVDAEGDVWIANPQQGHWLDDDGLARVARALKAGDI